MANQMAKSLDYLNLRPGPDTQSGLLTILPPDAPLLIVDQQGDWYQVHAQGQVGYVHQDYVELTQANPLPQTSHGPLHRRTDLVLQPLGPDRKQRLEHNLAALDDGERLVQETWNRYGGLLHAVAQEWGLDPALAAAVLATESGGRAFNPDGRMSIRFENHIFFEQWGQMHPELFRRHFAFDPQEIWRDHLWRPDAEGGWQPFHGDPAAEWAVLNFAARLDDTAARQSTSLGAPQIMGFNYASLGYATAQEMFNAFASSESHQILGFFDFVRARQALPPLQQQDFRSFAELYNGPGQADRYAALMGQRYTALRRLRGELAGVRGMTPTDPALAPAESATGFDPDQAELLLQVILQAQRTTLWMQRLLLILGGLGLLVGLIAGIWTQNGQLALILGGLGLLAFALYILARPARYLQESREAIAEIRTLLNQEEPTP